jgi:hypothetical protein
MSQDDYRLVSVGDMANQESKEIGIVWRIVMAVVGFNVAVLGWSLIMTVFLTFIGLPLFIVGLALMQAAYQG